MSISKTMMLDVWIENLTAYPKKVINLKVGLPLRITSPWKNFIILQFEEMS